MRGRKKERVKVIVKGWRDRREVSEREADVLHAPLSLGGWVE